MSFSTDVKAELVSVKNDPCCAVAQSYALLLFGRAFSGREMSLLTENEQVAAAYVEAIGLFSGVSVMPERTDAGNFKITVSDRDTLGTILAALGYDAAGRRRVNFAVLENECCFAAFIRGAFLACGTITDPDKEYHLEFSVPTRGLCEDLMKLFDEFEPVPKMMERAGAHILYLKNSTDIEDALTLMGAQECSMRVMGAKAYKSVKNAVNRKVNFENANLRRTVDAANRQRDAITYIQQKHGFDALPPELREIAALRFENEDKSNAQLARMLSESITASGVNHRLARIIRIADQLREKDQKQ